MRSQSQLRNDKITMMLNLFREDSYGLTNKDEFTDLSGFMELSCTRL